MWSTLSSLRDTLVHYYHQFMHFSTTQAPISAATDITHAVVKNVRRKKKKKGSLNFAPEPDANSSTESDSDPLADSDSDQLTESFEKLSLSQSTSRNKKKRPNKKRYSHSLRHKAREVPQGAYVIQEPYGPKPKKIDLTAPESWVMQTLANQGIQCLGYGGRIRDGAQSHDTDFYVFADDDVDLCKIFKEANQALMPGALTNFHIKQRANLEKNYKLSAIPKLSFDFTVVPKSADIKELLSKADTTGSAMAFDIHGNIIDPFNYYEHLKYHYIKHIKDPKQSFDKHPEQMIRAIRIAIKSKKHLPQPTLDAIHMHGATLSRLPVNHYHYHLSSLFNRGDAKKNAKYLIEKNLIPAIFPNSLELTKEAESYFPDINEIVKEEMQKLDDKHRSCVMSMQKIIIDTDPAIAALLLYKALDNYFKRYLCPLRKSINDYFKFFQQGTIDPNIKKKLLPHLERLFFKLKNKTQFKEVTPVLFNKTGQHDGKSTSARNHSKRVVPGDKPRGNKALR